MEKREQIDAARQEFAGLMRSIEGLDDAAMTARRIDQWGVREVLAHITGWALLDTEMLWRLSRGERPLAQGEERGTGESRNPGYAAGAASRAATEVVEELRSAFDGFVAAAEAVSEERFADGRTACRIMRESMAEHLREHRIEIEAYRTGLGLGA